MTSPTATSPGSNNLQSTSLLQTPSRSPSPSEAKVNTLLQTESPLPSAATANNEIPRVTPPPGESSKRVYDCALGQDTNTPLKKKNREGDVKTIQLPDVHIKGKIRNTELESEYRGEAIEDTQTREQFPHGKGVMRLSDGSIYFGQFDKSHRHGEGTLLLQDGKLYTGRWAESKFIKGFIVLPDGTTTVILDSAELTEPPHKVLKDIIDTDAFLKRLRGRLSTIKTDCQTAAAQIPYKHLKIPIIEGHLEYYGAASDGQQAQGHGVGRYHNGALYHGEFDQSLRHGVGTMVCKDGLQFIGSWNEGKFWNGLMISSRGNILNLIEDGQESNEQLLVIWKKIQSDPFLKEIWDTFKAKKRECREAAEKLPKEQVDSSQ